MEANDIALIDDEKGGDAIEFTAWLSTSPLVFQAHSATKVFRS